MYLQSTCRKYTPVSFGWMLCASLVSLDAVGSSFDHFNSAAGRPYGSSLRSPAQPASKSKVRHRLRSDDQRQINSFAIARPVDRSSGAGQDH